MTTYVATSIPTLPAVTRSGDVDNRATYISFGLAYILGHGAAALSRGDSPLVALPGWLPMTLLGLGFATGTVCATRAALHAQRGADKAEVLGGKLLGLSWGVGFGALILAITGLSSTLAVPELQTFLWPAGSGLVVGLLYLGEGAARRNVLHYGLGGWLALISTAALFFSVPGFFGILAVAGGGGYAVATVLEFRRRGLL
ncbi:ABC transporter permease [Nocardia sp. XZ_19_369]|uniref:ABC transporter permease n=1 Tax=Nocardia sp. XZ_19_369 TaxID=2769487 RepID=UPI00188EB417|nr:ABC transporter permease [Nocardia sp. XZ_19_369]